MDSLTFCLQLVLGGLHAGAIRFHRGCPSCKLFPLGTQPLVLRVLLGLNAGRFSVPFGLFFGFRFKSSRVCDTFLLLVDRLFLL